MRISAAVEKLAFITIVFNRSINALVMPLLCLGYNSYNIGYNFDYKPNDLILRLKIVQCV